VSLFAPVVLCRSPVAGHLQRVDRIHLITGGDQRHHPQAPIGLNPNHHLLRLGILLELLRDQLVQPSDPSDPLGQPGPTQPPTGLVLQLHIMVGSAWSAVPG
jgi:hypothetical protein